MLLLAVGFPLSFPFCFTVPRRLHWGFHGGFTDGWGYTRGFSFCFAVVRGLPRDFEEISLATEDHLSIEGRLHRGGFCP